MLSIMVKHVINYIRDPVIAGHHHICSYEICENSYHASIFLGSDFPSICSSAYHVEWVLKRKKVLRSYSFTHTA